MKTILKSNHYWASQFADCSLTHHQARQIRGGDRVRLQCTMSDGNPRIFEADTLPDAFAGIDAHNTIAEMNNMPRIVGCDVPKNVIGKG